MIGGFDEGAHFNKERANEIRFCQNSIWQEKQKQNSFKNMTHYNTGLGPRP